MHKHLYRCFTFPKVKLKLSLVLTLIVNLYNPLFLQKGSTDKVYKTYNYNKQKSLSTLPLGIKNIHMSVDTFSDTVFASVHTREMSNHTYQHFLQTFASLGMPQEVKTDNSPTYIYTPKSGHIFNRLECSSHLWYSSLPHKSNNY